VHDTKSNDWFADSLNSLSRLFEELEIRSQPDAPDVPEVTIGVLFASLPSKRERSDRLREHLFGSSSRAFALLALRSAVHAQQDAQCIRADQATEKRIA
jgi:hypothetical protein